MKYATSRAHLSSKKILEEESLNVKRSPLMYNLCTIKIAMEFLRLESKNMSEGARSQISDIDRAISEVIDEFVEMIKSPEFTN